MSVYSQYATGASVDVAVDESYSGLVGIYRMIEESALNEHAIFEHVIGCDFAETFTNNGAMNESTFEAINEASMGEIWGKVKEFLNKMWQKILGIIKNLITRIESVFIRDGKELVKKYDKVILEKMNSNKLNKMSVKYKMFTAKGDVAKGSEPEWFKTGVIDVIDKSKLGVAYSTEVGKAKSNDKAAATNTDKFRDLDSKVFDKDEYKPFTTDDIQELKDDALSAFIKGVGGSSTDTKAFASDMMEECFEEYDEEGFKSTDYTYCKDILEKSSKMLTYLKKQEAEAKKQYKNDIKEIEEIQKKYTKDMSKEDYNKKAGFARIFASRAIQLNGARSAVVGTIFAGVTAVYKKAASEARAMWVKAASYGGKAESTFLEAVAEVSDWEVEEMFA